MTVYLLVVTILFSFGGMTRQVDNIATQTDCQKLGDAQRADFVKSDLNATFYAHCYGVRKIR